METAGCFQQSVDPPVGRTGRVERAGREVKTIMLMPLADQQGGPAAASHSRFRCRPENPEAPA